MSRSWKCCPARRQAMIRVSNVVAMWQKAELCVPASTMSRWFVLLATDLDAATVC